ncbi:hypothetical protein [Nocardiopsis suaedae]|uniref:DUF2207 domain-containing protein n=1 Tax=Nocardiopsis suaedae TaxID=3018444 RepID=A0ABT4TPT2_9ACTN|nr:hypothetical protein [Nocardiopsis suaedae]MDA2806172.1 hypothetical protein [Nocardiopsis suaedae]
MRGPYVRRGGGGEFVTAAALLVVIAVIVCGLGYDTVRALRTEGVGALWSDGYVLYRVLALGALVGLLFAFQRMPRGWARWSRWTRWTVDVLPGGLGITEERGWRSPDGRAHVPWDAVRAISARKVYYLEPDGKSGGEAGVMRPVLDVYLRRDVPGLPDAAWVERIAPDKVDVAEAAADASASEDGRVLRVRLGGEGAEFEKAVRALTPLICSVRPDLFPSGLDQADQWFVPEYDHSAPGSAVPASAPSGEQREPRERRPLSGAPVFVDHRRPLLDVLVRIALWGAVFAGSTFLASNPFGWGPVLAGLLSLPLLGAVLFSAAVLVGTLLTLPRDTAPVGVRVGEDGIAFIRKRTMRLRTTVTTEVPWERVQAVVAREARYRGASGQKVIDIFLKGEDRLGIEGVPGVGLRLIASVQERPDSSAMARLVDFPASRLRIGAPVVEEADLRSQMYALDDESLRPERAPRSHLRAALLGFRPDLCHGFRTPPPE